MDLMLIRFVLTLLRELREAPNACCLPQVPLKTGLNLLHWKNLGVGGDGGTRIEKPVLISKIEISGVAFTSQVREWGGAGRGGAGEWMGGGGHSP